MKRLVRFLRLPSRRRRLLLTALVLLAAIRAVLGLLSFQRVHSLLARLHTPPRRRTPPSPAEEIVWAVEAAARYVPRATCLVQALAARVLLRRAGHPAELHIGVAGGPAERFGAHAWLESGGHILLGGEGPSRYTRIVSFGGERP